MGERAGTGDEGVACFLPAAEDASGQTKAIDT